MQCFRASRQQRLFQANQRLPARIFFAPPFERLFSSQSNGIQQPSNGFLKVRWVRKHRDDAKVATDLQQKK
jgi:hypothetical protein